MANVLAALQSTGTLQNAIIPKRKQIFKINFKIKDCFERDSF